MEIDPDLAKLLKTPKNKGSKPVKPPRPCVCGCGDLTKGGEFLPGHDARHKSALIREVKAGGNDDARAELERRGWLKFLDKSLNNDRVQAERKAGVRPLRVVSGGDLSEEDAKARVQRYNRSKEVARLLTAIGRYGKAAGERRIEMAIDDEFMDSIIAGTHPDLTAADRKGIAKAQKVSRK